MWVSAIKSGPSSSIIMERAPWGMQSGAPRTCSTYFKCHLYSPKVPQIKLSASPLCTITAAIAVVLVLIIAFAKSGVIPRLHIFS